MESLRSLDPAQNLEVDLSALRAKVGANMAAQGLEFNAPVPSHVEPTSDHTTPDEPVAEVVSLAARRHTLAVRRNWMLGLSAAAAVAAVGFTGWGVLVPQNPAVPDGGNGTISQGGPSLSAAGSEAILPGAEERLKSVGQVQFVAAGTFSEHPTDAPVYRVSKGADVSAGQVQKVANSLGMNGAVKKNRAGFTVTDSKGATLTVTVGELTSLSFDNPAAVRMECVPVQPGDGNVELPNPDVSQGGSGTGKPSTPKPNPGETSPSTPPATPDEPIELPSPTDTPNPTQTPQPTETPIETVPPAVRPNQPGNNVTNPKPTLETNPQTEIIEIGELQVLWFETTPSSDPEETSPEEVDPQATQNPSPGPTPCVMKVAGKAPSADAAVAEVKRIAASLGATVLSQSAGATQKDGLTTVSVPVKMPGQSQAQNWKAVVSETGVASIRANLGQETKIGQYKVISEAEAVKRLNNPKYGPLDVHSFAGSKAKIDGQIDLVSAQLTEAPLKQKNGSILTMPVYMLTDSQGRVWTVLAVAD